MDTYWNCDWQKCMQCGLCVKECEILEGGRGQYPDNWVDNPGCHRCDRPCQKVCRANAISIERW